MDITALVMSKTPYTRQWPGLIVNVLEGRVFKDAKDHTQAWKDAVWSVKTPHFFFLDDDDDLPEDYIDVLQECMSHGAELVYTDELARMDNTVDPDYCGDKEPYTFHRQKRVGYTQDAHLQNARLIHHLALCATAPAKWAVGQFPTRQFWPELPFYWCMAKRQTPVYVPRVGYQWNMSDTGLHTLPRTSIAMTRSTLWCAENL